MVNSFLRKALVCLALLALPGCVVVGLPTVRPMTEKVVGGEGKAKVLLLDISGVIRDSRGRGRPFRTESNLTARVKEALTRASADPQVRALVLRINSPGGDVTTTDIIHHEIAEFKKEADVPVVAELMDVAASGGYYIASSADLIVANPTTVTGSIGVVAYGVDASGLLAKVGISSRAIKSGRMKDMGSPLRAMTDEERRVVQSIIDSMYERFIEVVMEGRGGKLTTEELLAAADGRVYTAGQALDLKLIDRIGYLDEAIDAAKELAGVEEARVVTYARPSAYRHNIYSAAAASAGAEGAGGGGLFGAPATVNLLNIDAGPVASRFGLNFMYVWLP